MGFAVACIAVGPTIFVSKSIAGDLATCTNWNAPSEVDDVTTYGTPLFVRGSIAYGWQAVPGHNDFVIVDSFSVGTEQFEVYEARIPVSNRTHEFKISNGDWSTQYSYSSFYNGPVPLDQSLLLAESSTGSSEETNASLETVAAGCYLFRLEVRVPDGELPDPTVLPNLTVSFVEPYDDPAVFYPLTGHYYEAVLGEFFEVRDAGIARGGSAVVINEVGDTGANEQTFLVENFPMEIRDVVPTDTQPAVTRRAYWIGLQRIGPDLLWQDGTQYAIAQATWAPGEPTGEFCPTQGVCLDEDFVAMNFRLCDRAPFVNNCIMNPAAANAPGLWNDYVTTDNSKFGIIEYANPPVDRPVTINANVTDAGGGGDDTEISVTFSSLSLGGEVNAHAVQEGPPLPSLLAQSESQSFYNITTSATYAGDVVVCMSYVDDVIDEKSLVLAHFKNGQWVETNLPDYPDVENDVVCGRTGSLSPFAVVNDLEQLITDLQDDVYSINLPVGIENSLSRILRNSLERLYDEQSRNDVAARNGLNAFANAVHAQSGKRIEKLVGQDLEARARAIAALID